MSDPDRPQRDWWRHALALALALGITLAIVLNRERLARLDELAYAGAFLAMLVGNATVIFPVPGLIVVFALGGTLNPLLVGLVAGPGAALGELSGYLAGYGARPAADGLYRRIEGWMERYGLWVIFVLSAVPNPLFDLAGIVAGAMRIPWWQFLLVAWAGKTTQALMVAYAGALSISWVERLLTG